MLKEAISVAMSGHQLLCTLPKHRISHGREASWQTRVLDASMQHESGKSLIDRVLEFVFGASPVSSDFIVFHVSKHYIARFERVGYDDGRAIISLVYTGLLTYISYVVEGEELARLHRFAKEFVENPGQLPDLDSYNKQHWFQLIRGAGPLSLSVQNKAGTFLFSIRFSCEGFAGFELDAAQCRDLVGFLLGPA